MSAEAGSPSASGDPAAFSQHCYVDLILSEAHRALRDSLAAHQALLDEWRTRWKTWRKSSTPRQRRSSSGAATSTRMPAPILHRGRLLLTLYLSGFGATAAGAAERWQQALDLAAGCLPGLAPKDSGAVGGEVS